MYKLLPGIEEQPNGPAQLSNGARSDEKKNHKLLKDAYEVEVAEARRSEAMCCAIWH